jgi:hypothetical protein
MRIGASQYVFSHARVSSRSQAAAGRPRRVTLHDVARRAGVSQPTVSLVLGNHPTARIAPGTRERVLEAARALGYRPNVVARSLVRGRSYTLGVLVPDLANPFFADVVAGAERVASEAGYALLLCGEGSDPARAAAHLDTLLGRQIDGIILDATHAAELARALVAGDGAAAGGADAEVARAARSRGSTWCSSTSRRGAGRAWRATRSPPGAWRPSTCSG